jgi:acyl-CoA thioesterase
MRFTEILAGLTGDGAQWRAQVPDSWAQGRTVFGGLQAAIALRAMRSLVPDPAGAPVRTLQVVFIAPVPPGEVRVDTRLLRSGKSASQVEARIYDGDQLACLAVAIFGAPRSSVVAVGPAEVQPARPAAEVPAAPFLRGVMPDFLQHVESRWALGSLPFMGTRDTRLQMYTRLRDETAADECMVVALADIPPPLGLTFLKKPAPGSSMTWTLDFIGHDFGGPRGGADYWLLDGELIAARDGYLSQSFTVWNPQLKAVALSRQAMVVFA